jgi:hypothetical protein
MTSKKLADSSTSTVRTTSKRKLIVILQYP